MADEWLMNLIAMSRSGKDVCLCMCAIPMFALRRSVSLIIPDDIEIRMSELLNIAKVAKL